MLKRNLNCDHLKVLYLRNIGLYVNNLHQRTAYTTEARHMKFD